MVSSANPLTLGKNLLSSIPVIPVIPGPTGLNEADKLSNNAEIIKVLDSINVLTEEDKKQIKMHLDNAQLFYMDKNHQNTGDSIAGALLVIQSMINRSIGQRTAELTALEMLRNSQVASIEEILHPKGDQYYTEHPGIIKQTKEQRDKYLVELTTIVDNLNIQEIKNKYLEIVKKETELNTLIDELEKKPVTIPVPPVPPIPPVPVPVPVPVTPSSDVRPENDLTNLLNSQVASIEDILHPKSIPGIKQKEQRDKYLVALITIVNSLNTQDIKDKYLEIVKKETELNTLIDELEKKPIVDSSNTIVKTDDLDKLQNYIKTLTEEFKNLNLDENTTKLS